MKIYNPKGRPRVTVCKQGHALSGDNLVLKARSRDYNGKLVHWTERCCRTCYAKWREDWNRRHAIYSNKPKGEPYAPHMQPRSYLRATDV